MLCTPFETVYCWLSGASPVHWIYHRRGENRSYPLLNLVGLTALFLLSYNRNFLQGVWAQNNIRWHLSFQFPISLVFVCCTWRGLINAANG